MRSLPQFRIIGRRILIREEFRRVHRLSREFYENRRALHQLRERAA